MASYDHWFPELSDVEIADFSAQQIEDFVQLWFARDQEAVEPCLSELRRNPPIRELGTNPLLLTLLCLAFDRTMGFPESRAELYREAVEALLKRWTRVGESSETARIVNLASSTRSSVVKNRDADIHSRHTFSMRRMSAA